MITSIILATLLTVIPLVTQSAQTSRASDANAIAWRGVVEGYYGRPWGTEGRLSLLKFMGETDMNIFIYGPKDDPYHHSKWREPYPQKEMSDFKKLLKVAKANKINFCWAIHLGSGFKKGSEADFAALMKKLGWMYDAGFRSFAVFFDDFGSADADFHADVCNRVLKDFLDVKKDCAPLILCPNVYWGSGHPYQKTLGDRLDRRVHILWTGHWICSDIKEADVKKITADLKRPPFIWWNWPVNDFCRSKILLGRTYGLDKIKCAGFVSNPMENCEASKIALYGIAKWCRDPENFDSRKAWEESFKVLYKDPEVAKAMRVFAEHNSDQGPNGHGYRREESVSCAKLLSGAADRFRQAGRLDENDVSALRALFKEMGRAARVLQKKLPRGRYDLGWELEGWLDAQKYQAAIALKTIELAEKAIAGKSIAAVAAEIARFREESSMSAERHRAKFAQATFPGDRDRIPAPAVATREVQPFIDLVLETKLREAYKALTGRDFDAQDGFAAFSNARALKTGVVRLDGKYAGIVRVMEFNEIAPGESFGIRVPKKWQTDYFHAKLGGDEPVKAGVIELSRDGKTWTKLETHNHGEDMERPLDVADGWTQARYRNISNKPVRVKINQFKFDVRSVASAIDELLAVVSAGVGSVGEKTVLWRRGDAGIKSYRIPALCTAPNGDLIAACDARRDNGGDLNVFQPINITFRRSTDGGKTWSQPANTWTWRWDEGEKWSGSDPSFIVDEKVKKIFLFYNVWKWEDVKNWNNNVYRFYVQESSDNGKTWSKPRDISRDIAFPEWPFGKPRDKGGFIFITSGSGIQTKDGTLLNTLVHVNDGNALFGSEDHGKTWKAIGRSVKNGDECKVVELKDGSWMINSRWRGGGRQIHVSNDRGMTWASHYDTDLVDPQCNAQIMRLGKDVLLFSNCKSNGRNNLHLRSSIDEGKTWSEGICIEKGPSAYSDITRIGKDRIGVLFEGADYKTIEFTSLAVADVMAMSSPAVAEALSKGSALFDEGWRFAKFGKFSDCKSRVEPVSPHPAEALFNDSSWRVLDLPHDWGVESPFIRSEPNQTGSLPWNAVGWYRKRVFIPATAKGRRLYLDFDGVMMTPDIYVNGEKAGEWKFGYNSFRIDITPFVKIGEMNVFAVRVENKPDSTRWYPGAGIYRHVRLSSSQSVYLEHWGVSVSASKVSGIKLGRSDAVASSARLNVGVEVRNTTAKDEVVSLSGVVRTRGEKPAEIGAFRALSVKVPARSTLKETFTVDLKGSVPLWDIVDANMLDLDVALKGALDAELDVKRVPFGVRTAEWKADGFYLNGRRVQLKGVCQHHDMGPLGAAVHRRAIERQVEILETFGVNAIRTSHNPPAPEFLEICNERGMLVLDELFDCWKSLKEGKRNGYNLFWDEWRYRDVANWVRRDRNNPCVIAWSIGNEITEQGQGEVGAQRAKDLVTAVKSHDATRLVTCGCNDGGAAHNVFGDELDIHGFNYKPNAYGRFMQAHKGKPFFSSESSSCVSTRGFYSFPADDGDFSSFWNRNFCDNLAVCQVSDYSLAAPGWGNAPDVEMAAQEDFPQSAGEFVWTGFDYLGEPTPWNLGRKPANDFRGLPAAEIKRLEAELEEIKKQGTPSRSSYFGIVDLCGFRKDRAWLYQSQWMSDVPMAHILPHWNWKGLRDGKKTPVFVFTSGDSAELFLNGKSLGRRSKNRKAPLSGKDMSGDLRERFRLVWMDVVYESGKLEVVAYKNGKEWARDVVETTGPVVSFVAKADRAVIAADGMDLAYIEIDTVDAKGRRVPTGNDRFTFETQGPFELVGVCNGDPTDHESLKGNTIKAFNGKAQAIVRSLRGSEGTGAVVITRGGGEVKRVAVTSK